MRDFLSVERITAAPSYNRWLVPPAALATHLSIGMAYGFSVFWLPLSQAIGITAPAPGDWKVSTLGWMFTLFFVFLGSSAAIFGAWTERVGPRVTGLLAAALWSGGFLVAAVGIHLHQIALLWLGSGVIGGCGLGLGYISPVSTLIKWFPDRRGMATGMAIMGFGGGAMIGSPLADLLMKHFARPDRVGVWQTFLVLGLIYLAAMTAGALGYRVPPPGYRPRGYVPPASASKRGVPVEVAFRTPQFWLLWAALCLNVTAGIGILGMASPMIQEISGGRVGPSAAAGFAGLLSLFNIAGRIGWASLSDAIGRRATYGAFFLLGVVLYALLPLAGHSGSIALFVAIACAILTMYGGGFSTIPAYLADIFGTDQVSAIHGRILTAWSTAGVLGPVLVNYLRDYQLARGVPKTVVYDDTLWFLAVLLAVGFACNWLVRPLPESAQVASVSEKPALEAVIAQPPSCASRAAVAVAWAAVGVPLLWGTWQTVALASQLF
jgi:MFS family permease